VKFFEKKTKNKELKLDRVSNDIIDLQGKKRELEIELENMQLDLKNQKRSQEMQLEEEKHRHKLAIEAKDIEVKRTKEQAEEDRKLLEDRLRKEAELEQIELKAMSKLRTEQAIAKAEHQAANRVLEIKAEMAELKKQHAEELAKQKANLVKEHYGNLRENLESFHKNGSQSTQFIQELALKMMDRTPPHDFSVGVDVNGPKQIESSDE